MNKSELVTDMKRFCGGGAFINRTQLAAYLGFKDVHSADRFLYGLERVSGKKFFIPDVVEAMKVLSDRK